MINNKYLDVVYDESKKPLTNYPDKFTKYLFNRYKIPQKSSLLDIGCGRGEFSKGFINCGINVSAVDQSNACSKYCPEANLKVADIEKEGIPFLDNTFDFVYSKSVIEHFYNPEILVKEMYRVLKPGGVSITLCPAWEYNYKIYFEDYTHRSPFMIQSLKDIQLINGFIDVEVEFFRQLPILWNYKWMTLFADITRLFLPSNLYQSSSSGKLNKWIRFSKEIMLLSSSRKP